MLALNQFVECFSRAAQQIAEVFAGKTQDHQQRWNRTPGNARFYFAMHLDAAHYTAAGSKPFFDPFAHQRRIGGAAAPHQAMTQQVERHCVDIVRICHSCRYGHREASSFSVRGHHCNLSHISMCNSLRHGSYPMGNPALYNREHRSGPSIRGYMDSQALQALIDDHRPGHALTRNFYTDPDIFEHDMEHMLLLHWFCAGHASSIPRAGDYCVVDLGCESVMIVRST